MAYLFVHFKEKRTPDGEQVYFVISKDGYNWEQVNDGQPVLWSYKGDFGVRDMTVVRNKAGEIVIMATDLSLAYGLPGKYMGDWSNISRKGSKCLSLWRSFDLIHWSEQEMVKVGAEGFGCAWAPDIIYDRKNDDYVVHFSSRHACNGYGDMSIYYTRTKDFKTFTESEMLFSREDASIIDSHITEYKGKYYLFVKCDRNPCTVLMYESESVTGPYIENKTFTEKMTALAEGCYEGPTTMQTKDGRTALFVDHYAIPEEEQGYIPFFIDDLPTGKVYCEKENPFKFPYGIKHGTVLEITDEEYDRLLNYKKSPRER
ncbi:MAG: glycoside hydrolase family 43 protein [Lachnospiraceae bacterium]|nr:glycoside hydrolase family 43 protein [Lachnospiraceae bacterium]